MLHICYEISNYNEHALKIYVFNVFLQLDAQRISYKAYKKMILI